MPAWPKLGAERTQVSLLPSSFHLMGEGRLFMGSESSGACPYSPTPQASWLVAGTPGIYKHWTYNLLGPTDYDQLDVPLPRLVECIGGVEIGQKLTSIVPIADQCEPTVLLQLTHLLF